MSKTILLFLSLAIFSQMISAQIPLPRPISEVEIRDNTSVKMRSIQLERLKRDADKAVLKKQKDLSLNFSQIKEDFEEIQKLESEIIRIYKTAKKIDYRKISELAAQITKKAVRLENNLFSVKAKPVADQKPIAEEPRALIIALGSAVSGFVSNPIFNNLKLIEQKDAESCQVQLEKIIEKSIALSIRSRSTE